MRPCVACASLNLRKVTRQQIKADHYWCELHDRVEVACIGSSDCADFAQVEQSVAEKRRVWIAALK